MEEHSRPHGCMPWRIPLPICILVFIQPLHTAMCTDFFACSESLRSLTRQTFDRLVTAPLLLAARLEGPVSQKDNM